MTKMHLLRNRFIDIHSGCAKGNRKRGKADVSAHRVYISLSSPGPFIQRAIIASHTSEALWFTSEDVLHNPAAEKVE